MPSTSGSFTVYCSSYKSAGLKPFFRQMCAGSGVPGNGSFSHVANAQSEAAIFTSPLFTPVTLSDTADTSVAFVVSSVAAGYGDGVARGMINAAVLPLCSRMRMTSGPVMLLPSAHQRDVSLRTRRRDPVAPIDDGIDQHTARPGQIERFHQRERADVLDLAA